MAFEVVPTAAGRLHSDQYTKIIIINTPINLRVFPWCEQQEQPRPKLKDVDDYVESLGDHGALRIVQLRATTHQKPRMPR